MAQCPIVILGAGGHAREVMWLIETINAISPTYRILGYLDDNGDSHGDTRTGKPVLGALDWLESCGEDRVAVAMGVGSPVVKRRFHRRLERVDVSFPTLISPDAQLSPYVTIDDGVIITAGCIVTVDIHLGSFTALNRSVNVGHDARVGAYCTLNPGATLSGNTTLEEGCDFGTHAVMIQGRTVGKGSVIGAGAVVVRDIPANSTAVGVPARVIKTLKPWAER